MDNEIRIQLELDETIDYIDYDLVDFVTKSSADESDKLFLSANVESSDLIEDNEK